MTDQEYIKRITHLKKELDSLTNELWKKKDIRHEYITKERLQDHIVDDVFTYEKNILNIQANRYRRYLEKLILGDIFYHF